MDRYTIENLTTNQIICKDKQGGRHYRQFKGNVDKTMVIVKTTKGRALKECEWLNKEYYDGWEIREA